MKIKHIFIIIGILSLITILSQNLAADPLSNANWTLLDVDSEELVGEPGAATNAFDNNPMTIWHTAWLNYSPPPPHQISINLNGTYQIEGFRYLPRQDEGTNGNIGQYAFYVSVDGLNWNTPVASGSFDDSSSEKLVTFTPVSGRFVRLRVILEINGSPWTSMAELGIEVSSGDGTPSGNIIRPAADQTITAGDVVDFQATGTDPEGDLPLSFLWQFGTSSGVSDRTIEDPGLIQFNIPGEYVVTLTVTDSTGRTDPTPDSRIVRVLPGLTPIPQSGWQLLFFDSQELTGEDGAADNVMDGNPLTLWHTAYWNGSPVPPHEIQIDLGATYTINGFSYLPRQDGGTNGRIGQYQFYVTNDLSDWGTPVISGTFPNAGTLQEVRFDSHAGRFIRFRAMSEVNGNPWTAVSEINVFGNPVSGNQYPNGIITAPNADLTILEGDIVTFEGTGTDADANFPLSYHWNFGTAEIADAYVEAPGPVQFNTPGVYLVTLTVADALGAVDPTVATRSITVRSAAEPVVIPDWASVSQNPFPASDPIEINNPVLTAADITDVTATFVADPFLYHENGMWYLFVEVYNAQIDRGQIGLATSTNAIDWDYDRIVLSENFHLSFPHVFSVDGRYYMIPETYMAQSIRLYESTNFPYDWHLAATLVTGRPFVDSSIFYHNGMWWMFTGDTNGANCYLYYSHELTSGWVEHPQSPVVRSNGATARLGGRAFIYDNDRIIRVAQKSDIVYGEQVRAFQVDTLTETAYAEHEIPQSPIATNSGTGWNANGMHQYDPWWTGDQWIVAVDGYNYTDQWSVGVYTTPSVTRPNGAIDLPATNVTITAGSSVTFAGTGTDPDGNTPLTYLWNFGGGSGIANSTAEDPGPVQFNTAGVFTVSFAVTDANGLLDPTVATRVITVNSPAANQAPNGIIDLPATNVSIVVGNTIAFSGTGTDPDGNTPLTYLWNFGAGSGVANSTAEDPGLVQFNTAGVFTVALTVTDARGLPDATPATRVVTVSPIAVNQAPNGTIDTPGTNMTIAVGDAIAFGGTGTDPEGNTPLTHVWSFGTGSGIANSTLEDPGFVQFNTAGVFTITFTVTDATGLADPTPATRVITVVATSDTIPQTEWRLHYVDSEELVGEDGQAENAFDGNPDTIWHTQYTGSSPRPPHEIQIDLGAAYDINGFRYLPRQDGGANGRIGQYEFYISDDPTQWGSPVATGVFPNTAVEQEILFADHSGRYVRLRALTEANNNPWTAVAEINLLGAYASGNRAPNGNIDAPSANITITVGDTVTFGATGSDPDSNLPLTYLWHFGTGSGVADVAVEDPGAVRFNNPGVFTVTLTVTDALGASDPSVATRVITVSSTSAPLPQTNWQLLFVDSEELVGEDAAATNAFDGDPATIWHTAWYNTTPSLPHEIRIDLGATYNIDGFSYLPRQDGGINGRIGQYEFYVSNDPLQWGSPIATGVFQNTASEKQITINRTTGRYIRLRALTEANGFQWTSMAEINVLGGSN